MIKNNYFKNLNKIIGLSLLEDATSNDITSNLLLSRNYIVEANIISKEYGVLCGIPIVKKIISRIDKSIKIKIFKQDGKKFKKNTKILTLKGKIKSILKIERVLLNYLGILSGISTKTNKLMMICKKYKSKICCTRKTIPGLRHLQKYAVSIGGGTNNRFNLEDEIFVKDNHYDELFNQKICKLIKKNKSKKKITVEVDNLSQVKNIINYKIDRILLDNMKIDKIKKCLKIIPRNIETEVSGNISESNILRYAKTRVNRISLGSLTHTIRNIDFSLIIKTR